jgi:hypothetical protein
MVYNKCGIHSSIRPALLWHSCYLRCPNCVDWAGDGYSTHRGDQVRDLSLPGSCAKTYQAELLWIWNGLNWLRRQCSGAILRTRRDISDQLLRSSVPCGYYYYDDDVTTTTATTTRRDKNMLLWTEKNHEAGVVLRFAFCTLERDLDNLRCRLDGFIFLPAAAAP